ncbi:GNAT family N-acetyltransferase [Ruegeria sp. 2012CJ41-6]|uniref:GNAT family N-acetyltransferase n=1 Tax=Ruegeria spongiae TaxID=2942209 RepID=A0ABT0Q4J8_9RHOB|nr:GNAT family N-acetyltransferase [Ruegeria spongiae]MCL6284532.1 GNAT family N-acetyltransferase [Ruegeria spongiae]
MTGTTLHIPTLETERLTLRAPRLSDLDAYAAFCASPRSVGVGGPYSRTQAFDRMSGLIGQWHLRGYGRWMVADATTDAPLGVVCLFFREDWPEPEIAWSVFDAAEGRGIALEAALVSRTYAYDVLGWDTVVSCMMSDNIRSAAVAKRMGATPEAPIQHPVFGEMQVWRHLSPDQIENGGMEAYA